MSGLVSTRNRATESICNAQGVGGPSPGSPHSGHTQTQKRKHGGWRLNAGRRKSKELRYDPSHAKRPDLSYRHGVHVMLRTRWGVPRLRQRCGYEAIRRSMLRYVEGEHFRIVHVSIQKNHLHFIVEASSKKHLSQNMQSFAIRAARALNAAFDREGKVFAFRYNAKQIRTESYARNAISYVLNNWRRHREDWYEGEENTLLDAFSSASAFTGWAEDVRSRSPAPLEPLPVSQPRTALLSFDWQWHGLIDPWEMPGPLV